MASQSSALMVVLAATAGLLGMMAALNAGLRSERTARCPGRARRELAAAGAGGTAAAPCVSELAAIVEVLGGVQVVECVDVVPGCPRAEPAEQPVLTRHRHHVAA